MAVRQAGGLGHRPSPWPTYRLTVPRAGEMRRPCTLPRGCAHRRARFVCFCALACLSCSPAVPLVGKRNENMLAYRSFAVCVIAKTLETTQVPPARRQDEQIAVVHALEYSAAIKREEMLVQEPLDASQGARDRLPGGRNQNSSWGWGVRGGAGLGALVDLLPSDGVGARAAGASEALRPGSPAGRRSTWFWGLGVPTLFRVRGLAGGRDVGRRGSPVASPIEGAGKPDLCPPLGRARGSESCSAAAWAGR